ncbi:glucose-dependent insulinotropic receptor [Eublepharis macularius]|uniref:Glucose-dependent insulinotropic receptor n=1 Tax=Eublepharis macularius TaxID=481883 RepID=A0AA97KC73_EUBMA|nr:glucose-dependent insulinotropic receptor [Eublepharis macularius]
MGNVGFGVVLAVLALLIITINALVAVALVRLIWKSGCRGLCFVLNLAIADSLVGFTITGLVTEELSGPTHQTPRNYCILRMACIVCPSAASILTVILVAFDRYLAIKHPFRYFKFMHGLVVGACIGGLWLLAFLIGFLPLIVQSFQKKNYEKPCTFFGVFQPTYMLTVFCVAFIPALFAFIYVHFHLLKIASSHAQQIREREQIHASGTCPAPQSSSETKAMRTIAILVGSFALSWSPFFVGSIVQMACHRCFLHHLLEHYLWVLGLCNSLINPLVYAYWQKEVRLQIYQICLCMKRVGLGPFMLLLSAHQLSHLLSFSTSKQTGYACTEANAARTLRLPPAKNPGHIHL